MLIKKRIKKFIRMTADRLFSYDAEKLKKCITSYNMVSFDLFDTLIKRDVRVPEDVFQLVQEKYSQKYCEKISDYSTFRQKAEKSAKECTQAEEISIYDIYEKMPYSEIQKKRLLELELEIETEICTVNLPMKEIYDICVQEGKKVCFISDMYLPVPTVKAILQKCGYSSGELFLSSQYCKRKRTGNLFAAVKGEMSEVSWLHIGDNLLSDVLAARKAGVTGRLIKRDAVHTRYSDAKRMKEDYSYGCMMSFVNNRVDKYRNPYERLGYEVFGPILYGFAMWLDKNTKDDDKIIFLAREGEILKRAFEMVSLRKDTEYMYVSRHAVSVPYLSDFGNYEEFKKKFRNNIHRMVTNAEFCYECGLDVKQIEQLLLKLELKAEDMCTKDNRKRIVDMAGNIIKDNARKQKKLIENYIAQLAMTEHTVLVDVGWYGTIQKQLAGLCLKTGSGNAITFRGLYIGTLNDETDELYLRVNKQGYIDSLQDKYVSSVIAYTITFFEMFFLGTDGTTIGYQIDEETEKVVPVLGKSENIAEEQSVRYLQNAALDFVKDMTEHILYGMIDVTSENALKNYIRLVTKADKKTLSLFANFKAYDGNEYFFVGKENIWHYVLHPCAFKKDFLNNRCKLWFLKNLLCVPFPYVQFLDFLKRFDR